MILEELQVTNFRIYKSFKKKFNSKINVIYGSNGQGKTSVLEAIYYLALTKSFRTNKDIVSLKSEEEFFDLKGSFINKDKIKQQSRIYFSKKESKHAFLNSERVKTFSELVGHFPVILLSLEDINLTFGLPAVRRKFLDILLSQLYPVYLQSLQKYKKAVQQKNRFLSDTTNENKISELEIWNSQIIEYGSEIVFRRIKFINYINKHITKKYNVISGKTEQIKIDYNSFYSNKTDDIELITIKNDFLTAINKAKEKEWRRQTSLVGPHKDDFFIFKEGYPFKSHGSQGENKSILLALKLLESDYVYHISHKKPILLLDDIFGELDNNRVHNLLSLIIEYGQVFITTTDLNKFKTDRTDNTSHILIKDHTLQ